jgi:hypothetical protein
VRSGQAPIATIEDTITHRKEKEQKHNRPPLLDSSLPSLERDSSHHPQKSSNSNSNSKLAMSRVDPELSILHSDFYRFFVMSSNKENGKVAEAAAAANNNGRSPQQQRENAGSACASRKQKNTTTSNITKGGFTLDRINDILDFETEHIMMTRENRQEHFDAFLVRVVITIVLVSTCMAYCIY